MGTPLKCAPAADFISCDYKLMTKIEGNGSTALAQQAAATHQSGKDMSRLQHVTTSAIMIGPNESKSLCHLKRGFAAVTLWTSKDD